jgi:molecular chaperone GrpE (heat shock protein)
MFANVDIIIFLLVSFPILIGAVVGFRFVFAAINELKARRRECVELQNQLQELVKEKEALRQEGLRLHQELQQQRIELIKEFRSSTFEELQTLLTNYPSIHQMVSVKPELPAKNLLSMFTPLANLLKEWGYEQIGKPWEQVPYNPQIHQPDAADIAEGEMLYIRFVGYRHQENILCPAKVSRTLPGGRE